MKARGPAKSPTATNDRAKRSTRTHVVIAVEIEGWRLRFAVDEDPTTGELRDLSATVAAVVGCEPITALAAVLDSLDGVPVAPLASAA